MVHGWTVKKKSGDGNLNGTLKSTTKTLKECKETCIGECKSFSFNLPDKCYHYNVIIDISKAERMEGSWLGLDPST